MKHNGRKAIWLLAITFFLLGCSGPRGAEKQLGAYISGKCGGNFPCRIDVHQALPFDWDKMYVFDYTVSRAEIEHVVGGKIGSYRELSRYWVFTKAESIVRYEYETTDVEHPFKGEVIFALPDSAHYQEYGVDASFDASEESSEAGAYYLLKQVR